MRGRKNAPSPIGEVVRWLRVTHTPPLTQEELAAAAGVPKGSIGSVESGVSRVPRDHVIGPILREHLASHPHALVFAGATGGPFSTGRAWRALATLLAKHQFSAVSPHSLRHSYATFLLARGVPLTIVARYLGHARISLSRDLYGDHEVAELGAVHARELGAFLLGDDPAGAPSAG